MIAVVKDLLIYITVFAAIIAVPIHLGGYGQGVRGDPAAEAAARGAAGRHATARSAPMRRWRSARPARCSCIRTRSPAS